MQFRARLAACLALATAAAAACTGSGGGDNGGRPVVRSFTVDPATLPAGGGRVTLSWAVTGADQITIDPMPGAVTGASAEVDVSATTFFMLSASNAKGTTTRSAVVMVAASSKAPVILSFTATPPSLPAGGGRTTLTWQVLNADSLTIDHGVGAVTSDSVGADVTATTIYTLTATNADGTSTGTTAVVIGQNPSRSSNNLRYCHMVSPSPGESFIAPATLRLTAAALDRAGNAPGSAASKVQFFVDDAVVLEAAQGSSNDYWVFKGFASGIASGTHRVWARAIDVNPDAVYDCEPVLITVSEPPVYERIVDLAADVVLARGESFVQEGTASRRIRINGNGHRIISNGDQVAANLTLRYVDVFDLGNRSDLGQPALDVTANGAVTIEDSSFDDSNLVRLTFNDASTASIRRNLFRSNMRMPLSQNPDPTYDEKPSFQAVLLRGSSTGAKVFAGNNVGASWVHFLGVKSWLIGGDADEDSNVLIGPRAGIHVQKSSDVIVRRNYSHHTYYGGWSQGNNFELQESPGVLVEHNVIYGSSWPVREVGGEFRYNLVLEAGHQWMWASADNGYIHHNVFVGGEADGGGIWVSYEPTNVRIANNTFDSIMTSTFTSFIKITSGALSVTSNLFMRHVKSPAVVFDSASATTAYNLSADYNLFFDAPGQNYGDGRQPAHDVAGGAQTDPLLTQPAGAVFELDEANVWKRNITVRDVLGHYRMRYTPKAGSPAIDAGDPAGGAGNDVGAVGAGDANAADRFGLF
jgi:hypothetical protein